MRFYRFFCMCLVATGLLSLAGQNIVFAKDGTEVHFTTEEADWLSHHPTIRIGPDPTFSPIEYFDDDGNFHGIAADYLRLLEKKLGISFQIERLDNWNASIEKAKNQEIDVWTAAVETPQRAEYMLFTEPYLKVPAVIMVRDDSEKDNLTLESLDGMRVAVVEGYAVHDFIINSYPHLQVILVPDVETGLQKLSFGEIGAFVGNIATAARYAETAGIGNIRVAGNSGYYYKWALANRKDWPLLTAILQKGLDAITEAESQEIQQRWISLNTRETMWTPEFIFGLMSTALLIIVVGMLLWTRSLQKRVETRTNTLQQELSARREVEEKLQKQKNLLDEVGSLAIIGGWEVDLRTNELRWSTATYHIHEVDDDFDLTPASSFKFYAPEARETVMEAVEHAKKTGEGWDLEVPIITAQGRHKWARVRGQCEIQEGKVIRLFGAYQDITYRREVQKDLQRSKEELATQLQEVEYSHRQLEKQASELVALAEEQKSLRDKAELGEKSKSDFLATMSHEIRTPMTGILGMADLLLMEDLTADQRKQAQTIRSSGEILLTILNDILDQSKLDAGKFELSNSDIYLPELIESSLSLLNDRAKQKKLSLVYTPEENLPTGINIDAVRLRQILTNLVTNSIKFTETGAITLLATRLTSPGKSDRLRFEVTDNGIGISHEHQQRLFQRFEQADASTVQQYGGSGLGLSICKQLVELMEGEIGVESELGKGSTFWFTIPLRHAIKDVTPVDEPPAIGISASKENLKILLAEDNTVNQILITALLSQAGHSTFVVDNGKKAVEAALAGEYDLALFDVRMPVMDGPEATRTIRASGSSIANLPIIAITADAMKEHLPRYYEAGMNAVETKPIDLPRLLSTMDKVLEAAKSGKSISDEDRRVSLELVQPALGDEQKFLELCDQLGRETILDLLHQIPDSLVENIDRLKTAIDEKNKDDIRSAAHAIRGMSSSMCAVRLALAAADIEDRAEKTKEVKALLPKLEDIIQETLDWWARISELQLRDTA
ncbi:transporter substrate-binding domain-containing protein [Sneathiella marina]|uniref:histidine kinase n=1 Tax=Sneathiella marina TaxID=2950108 RepID=A0ABY4VY81_9PROT|nr:transporter substrate-binding domain-containing protein [Sneathiella marina]USG59885.1 transporter substrate-binding domain-containing protein [Sneathiella marina]